MEQGESSDWSKLRHYKDKRANKFHNESKSKMKNLIDAVLNLYTKQFIGLNSVTNTSLQNIRLD